MKVCIVTVAAKGMGGMQDHGRALARGLVGAGHDVHVIAAGRREGADPPGGATWHWLDVPTMHPRLPRRSKEWFHTSYAEFERLHRELQFNVVHSESTSALELMRRGAHRSVPIVLKLHGNYLGEARQAMRRIRNGSGRGRLRDTKKLLWHTGMHLQRGEWHRFRPCEWMVTSEHEFDDARREAFLVRSRGHVVPNGIDTEVFQPGNRDEIRRRLGIGDVPLLVCAGRLDPLKGTSVAVRALDLLRNEGTNARLAVIGAGVDLPALQALASELRLDGAIDFIPPQPHDSLAQWLAAADTFVFPTQLNEAAPLIPLQAMACATPVIASDVGTLREMIGVGRDAGGLLVPSGSPRELADAIHRLISSPLLRRELSERAVARVEAKFTLTRMIDRTVEVYDTARRRAA